MLKMPNSAAASDTDFSTLISPQTPSQRRAKASAKASGEDDAISDRTMNSPGAAKQSMARRVDQPNPAFRRLAWFLLALVGFSITAFWKFKVSRPLLLDATSKSQQTPASDVGQDKFSIFFESTPAGAQVWEGSELLGTTPFARLIDRASVKSSPRKFVFKLDSYEPFVATQGDATHDLAISAYFTHLDTVASVANPSPSTLPRKVPRITGPSKPGSTPAKGPPAAGAEATPTDIRSQR
jgi:hypothetical protein